MIRPGPERGGPGWARRDGGDSAISERSVVGALIVEGEEAHMKQRGHERDV